MKILAIDVPGRRTGGWAFHDGKKITVGDIFFDPESSEKENYLQLAKVFDSCMPDLVVVEHGFIFEIIINIGAMKMLCAIRNRPWYMIGPSKAKKIVLGKGNTSKIEVKQWAEAALSRSLTQHQADSVLYLAAWLMLEGGGSWKAQFGCS